MFYNAHFVDTEIPALVGGTQSMNLILQSDGGSLTWLFVLPPVLLLAAGVVAGVIGGATDAVEGARSGAFLFRYSVGEGNVTPTLVTAVLLAGVVYPAIFGALGGAVSTGVSSALGE